MGPVFFCFSVRDSRQLGMTRAGSETVVICPSALSFVLWRPLWSAIVKGGNCQGDHSVEVTRCRLDFNEGSETTESCPRVWWWIGREDMGGEVMGWSTSKQKVKAGK
jgi:hypothetical protein